MRDIDDFAQAPQTTPGRYENNTTVDPNIIKYLEDECDLRQFFKPEQMQGVLSKTFKIQKDEGIAVQIAGNSEVPRAENVQRLFTVFLHRNATGYKIDDDDKKINPGRNLDAERLASAMERMLKKERQDMMQVFKAAPQATLTETLANFTTSTIKDAVDAMVTGNIEDTIEPTMIFMSYKVFRQLAKDPNFKYIPELLEQILLKGTIGPNGKRTKHSGPTGQYVDGIEIFLVNELGNEVILLDTTKEALWLAEDTQPTVTKYRDYEHISDIVDIRFDEQPVCVRPECLYKITLS